MSYKHKYVRISTKNQPRPLGSVSSCDIEYNLIIKDEYKFVCKIIKSLSKRDQFILNFYVKKKNFSKNELLKSIYSCDTPYTIADIRGALRRFHQKYKTYLSMKIHDS